MGSLRFRFGEPYRHTSVGNVGRRTGARRPRISPAKRGRTPVWVGGRVGPGHSGSVRFTNLASFPFWPCDGEGVAHSSRQLCLPKSAHAHKCSRGLVISNFWFCRAAVATLGAHYPRYADLVVLMHLPATYLLANETRRLKALLAPCFLR